MDALVDAHGVQHQTYGQQGVHLVIVLGDLPYIQCQTLPSQQSDTDTETTVNLSRNQDFERVAFSRQTD